ncbi:ABC transporter substrate-binding protein [Epidermidibacterium keratini]|uniref:ABC transporter substrate-binding protein n=1 Tax=Epidermidibacterium keratini TaxID=1891644 RepID=A0A7L4YPA5_9ACTN|nr:ABC transporter substrate-binding protein [Epidermidibacterium keratini]QHC01121.1 ABC transporter substrate-binding protein [Epidermidibacterium keratini]
MKRTATAVVASSAVVSVLLTGCSTKADNSGGSGSGDSGGVKTDVGVTDSEITLGVQTDTSGVFKVLGLGLTNGNQMWVEDVNAAGGICGRDIKLDVQDNGYKPDNALPLYDQQKTTSLGLVQLIGSPILAALKQKLINDKMVAIPSSWASTNLDAPEVMMVGPTYDVEMINGLSWMKDQGMIADGDKIGHIYIDSEYGQNGLLGSEAFAKENGMTVQSAPVAGTDTDMTAIMAKMKDDGVKAIAITLAPAATGSVVVQNAAQGMNLPILGSSPVFAPNLLADQSVTAAMSNLYIVGNTAPYGDTESKLAGEIAQKYPEKYSDEPNLGVNQGYVEGLVWGAVLEQACSDGDLTRDGILAAKKKVTEVDTQGLMGPLDFSKEGAPSGREVFIQQADASIPGGLKNVEPLFVSDEAKNYKAPFEK